MKRKIYANKFKMYIGLLVAFTILTVIYVIVLYTVPSGLAIRRWYRAIGLIGILLWQFVIIVVAVKKGGIGRWICCVLVILFLILVWIVTLFSLDLEYLNRNGTITVVQDSGFLQESEYSLWEKQGSLYRRFIRESAGREDTDPNITKEQFLKENYPELYENLMQYRERINNGSN